MWGSRGLNTFASIGIEPISLDLVTHRAIDNPLFAAGKAGISFELRAKKIDDDRLIYLINHAIKVAMGTDAIHILHFETDIITLRLQVLVRDFYQENGIANIFGMVLGKPYILELSR